MDASDLPGLGRQIQALRVSRRMTQESLASAAGISPSYLRKIEKGKANPSVNIIQRIAARLDVALRITLETASAHSPRQPYQ